MKKTLKNRNVSILVSLSFLLLAFASCKKDTSADTSSTTLSNSAVAASQAIVVSVSGSDSIYVVGTCAARHRTDSIAFSTLPSAIATYLSANYAGYTSQKAYTDKDSTGTLAGYVVIINYNGKPVGLKFDATGAFVKVLEQREGHDLIGNGYHHGGHFDDRDGLKRDSIALSTLPTIITSYFAFNYPTDTLVSAYKGKDSSIIVLSTNNGTYATVFSASGTFVKRVTLPTHAGHSSSIAQSALPATALTYLTNTYPNYVFKHAFAIKTNSVVTAYVVFIDANATKYAIEFDASGNFVKAVTVK